MSIKEWERTGLDSPSTTTCPQDDDVTLIHVKVDVHKYRISFWPETGEVLHSNQRSHGFSHRSHADGTKRLTQSSFSRNGPGYRLSRRRGVMQSISLEYQSTNRRWPKNVAVPVGVPSPSPRVSSLCSRSSHQLRPWPHSGRSLAN